MDKNFRMRLGMGFVLIGLLGLGVVFRAAHLMLIPEERLGRAMERQFRNDAPKIPRRGYILDRNKEPIAVSMEVKSLFANPNKIENKNQSAQWIAKALNLPLAQVKARLRQDKGFIWIKRQLNDTEMEAVEDLFEKHPSLTLTLGLAKESKRFYPNQSLSAHILGFTGMDSNGLEGLELVYQKELMNEGDIQDKKGTDGKTLVLTIDKTLQYTLEAELEAGMARTSAKAATAILMDADTGDIIAMASTPTYNPNKVLPGFADARRNRAVTDTFEPGSTIKPLLVAGALEAKIINPKTKVFCENGSMMIGKHKVNEAETHEKWGWLKIGEVLQHSSNVGATKIGFLFGAERTFQWYKKMGLTLKTGVDLPGEVGGVLSDPKKWSKIAHSNISFGQGMTVTPLQVLRAYAALVNGGKLVKPRLVKDFYSFEGEHLSSLPLSQPVKIMEEKTAQEVIEMLSKVATPDGTAPKASIPGFTVIGKTGTAQKAIPGVGYKSGKYIASFVGFVKDVKPRTVAFVMVDEPKFPYYGGEAAAPIFQKIMTAALAREGIAPDEKLLSPIILAEQKKPEKVLPKVLATDSQKPEKENRPLELLETADGFTMPNLNGVSAREVMNVFGGKNLQLRLKGGGMVVEQFPSAGTALKKGDTITVRLSRDEISLQ